MQWVFLDSPTNACDSRVHRAGSMAPWACINKHLSHFTADFVWREMCCKPGHGLLNKSEIGISDLLSKPWPGLQHILFETKSAVKWDNHLYTSLRCGAMWDMSHLSGGSGGKNFRGSVSLDFGWKLFYFLKCLECSKTWNKHILTTELREGDLN